MYDTEDIDMVGVIGAGAVGNGIARVVAVVGYDIVIHDLEPEYVEHGLLTVDDSPPRFVSKEKPTGDGADATKARATGTTELANLRDCDPVIKTTAESIGTERDIFTDLDDVVPEGVMLATNTSTLPTTTIVAATECPELVVSLRFMNPVSTMKDVEAVYGGKIDDDVAMFAHDFSGVLGKEMRESGDKLGFVTNRVLMPWLNEGVHVYDEGVTSKENIDRGMTLGTNVPMGPLTFADHIGLDICLNASEMPSEEPGDCYEPTYLFKRKVAVDDLDKKTGKGLYGYN